jgi:hypothetical protein
MFKSWIHGVLSTADAFDVLRGLPVQSVQWVRVLDGPCRKSIGYHQITLCIPFPFCDILGVADFQTPNVQRRAPSHRTCTLHGRLRWTSPRTPWPKNGLECHTEDSENVKRTWAAKVQYRHRLKTSGQGDAKPNAINAEKWMKQHEITQNNGLYPKHLRHTFWWRRIDWWTMINRRTWLNMDNYFDQMHWLIWLIRCKYCSIKFVTEVFRHTHIILIFNHIIKYLNDIKWI